MTKYLFSPGPIPKKEEIEINFSHRDEEFSDLIVSVKEKLLDISHYYNDIIMTQGSASSAIETIFSSLFKKESKILVFANGAFGNRAIVMADFYSQRVDVTTTLNGTREALRKKDYDFFFSVQFETSLSLYNNLEELLFICKNKKIVTIVDAVSSFPYYELQKVDFLITSSAKQLGGLPVMGLIFYDKEKEYELQENSDYLSFKKYKQYSLKNQTPHTSLIPQILSLDKSLNENIKGNNIDGLFFKNSIFNNCQTLVQGLEDCVLNTAIAPVITFKVKDTEKVIEHLHSLGIKTYFNLFYMKDYIQVSTFNYTDNQEPYRELNEVLRGLKEQGLL